jgi:site-specific DNA recombinase
MLSANNSTLAEALDRISRDQADVATLFKHLRCRCADHHADGGRNQRVARWTQGHHERPIPEGPCCKTHRGLRGRVEDGKSGGGLRYSYRVVEKLDERGELIRGDREIEEAQASVARRISNCDSITR